MKSTRCLHNDIKNHPLVSIITPTRGREQWLPSIWRCVLAQQYQPLEWLIGGETEEARFFARSVGDVRVRYIDTNHVVSIGEKRNALIEAARGTIIAHFDDDDYYSPEYLALAIRELIKRDADVFKLSGFFVQDVATGQGYYWDQASIPSYQFVCRPNRKTVMRTPDRRQALKGKDHLVGFGFSYVYKKQLWETIRFPHISFSEDLKFMMTALRKGAKAVFIKDVKGVSLHRIHDCNTSGCFPQYILPNFLTEQVFPTLRGGFLAKDRRTPGMSSLQSVAMASNGDHSKLYAKQAIESGNPSLGE